MAAYNKFNDFVEQLAKGKHVIGTHVFKAYLSNEAPLAADTVKTDIAEITAQNGYPSGGSDAQLAVTESGGTATVTAVDIVWTASGGSFGPFRYIIIYNDTQTSPADALVCWFDYGAAVTVLTGETFTVDFGGSLFTLA
jgi:hypothetical protein